MENATDPSNQTDHEKPQGHGFGTLPVFFAAISTILGAVMFLRFGYAVGHVGLLGVFGIIALGHMVTVPTAMAIAEIATNRKVEGGGEYFIISQSFGITIGSVVGSALWLSQAVSVAFYLIAFAEAFEGLAPQISEWSGLAWNPRLISIPATLGLLALMLVKGADLGVKALYAVVVVLGASIVLFFLGSPLESMDPNRIPWTATLEDSESFFIVFAICFPAFTGMTAGVGLSGDLANPRKSIPLGTLLATFAGMLVYVAIAIKLAYSAPAEELANDQLIMARIALWAPIIPIGLACATVSSAIGSVLVAPRTLQAIAGDRCLPSRGLNNWLSRGVGKRNEPRNATLVTGVVALAVVALGDVNIVARLISMFFMVTYGSLCAVSFLHHFASQPSYRPSFYSRWYISLFGALVCLFIMFQMDPLFAILSLVIMTLLHRLVVRYGQTERNDLAAMMEGVLAQVARHIRLKIQREAVRTSQGEWRPSILMINALTFERNIPLVFLNWLCHKHGFGTYLHLSQGFLNADTYLEGEKIRKELRKLAQRNDLRVSTDVIISPSMISALAQSLQIPGVSGQNNNAILFELARHDGPEVAMAIAQYCQFSLDTGKTLLVLRHGDLFFGQRQVIHVWLTWNDQGNANLMILLGYILMGHPDWRAAELKVYVAIPQDRVEEERKSFEQLVESGRLPVSIKNVHILRVEKEEAYRDLVANLSSDADLTILGFGMKSLADRKEEVFLNHPKLKDVLYVCAAQEISMD